MRGTVPQRHGATHIIRRFAMKPVILAAALLSFSFPALADKLGPCSVKAKKGTPVASLKTMAKVSVDAAEKAAVAKAGADMKVTETELEVEDGCLVYSVDLKADGKPKLEVLVDAGDGKILAQKETGIKGAVGKVKDKLTPNK
jgi:uncharacterized membrane protein YkoI